MLVPQQRKRLATVLTVALAVTLLALRPGYAEASTQAFFDTSFAHASLDPVWSVMLPTGGPAGANSACLTVGGNDESVPMSCRTATARDGNGALRLTGLARHQVGGFFIALIPDISPTVVTTFHAYQYGAETTPGDGFAFVAVALNPESGEKGWLPDGFGAPGGGLGYSSVKGAGGLPYGYLGVGFDVYGGFSSTGNQGSGCPFSAYASSNAGRPGQVVVRGPGHKSVGYCAVNSTATTADARPLRLHAPSKRAAEVPVETVLNPEDRSVRTKAGTQVPAESYAVTFTTLDGHQRSLRGPLPKVPAGLYPPGWLDADGYPRKLMYGVVASTGGVRDVHEVADVVAEQRGTPVSLSVDRTVYLPRSLVTGDAVTQVVHVGTGYGDPSQDQVAATFTLADGVRPVAASGRGWACGQPVGQRISCRLLRGEQAFDRSDVVVQGLVTRAGLARPDVVAGSRIAVSAEGAPPLTSDVPDVADPPDDPGTVSLSPVHGTAGTPITLQGQGVQDVSAIRIGTAAELASGAAPVVLGCDDGVPKPCSSRGWLPVRQRSLKMPAHPSGPVQIELMGLGRTVSLPFGYD